MAGHGIDLAGKGVGRCERARRRKDILSVAGDQHNDPFVQGWE